MSGVLLSLMSLTNNNGCSSQPGSLNWETGKSYRIFFLADSKGDLFRICAHKVCAHGCSVTVFN